MDALFEQLGATMAAFLEHPIIHGLLVFGGTYVLIIWLATAWWALQDLRRRHRDPAMPFVAAAGIILASPLLFPLAVIVYRVLRPGETLAESRERDLADRLTSLEAQERLGCPECGTSVDESWLACPACRSRLAHQCLGCGQSMGLDWVVCAWCGTEFGQPVIPETVPLRRAAQRAATTEYARRAEAGA